LLKADECAQKGDVDGFLKYSAAANKAAENPEGESAEEWNYKALKSEAVRLRAEYNDYITGKRKIEEIPYTVLLRQLREAETRKPKPTKDMREFETRRHALENKLISNRARAMDAHRNGDPNAELEYRRWSRDFRKKHSTELNRPYDHDSFNWNDTPSYREQQLALAKSANPLGAFLIQVEDAEEKVWQNRLKPTPEIIAFEKNRKPLENTIQREQAKSVQAMRTGDAGAELRYRQWLRDFRKEHNHELNRPYDKDMYDFSGAKL
jgi:hypothetical protein